MTMSHTFLSKRVKHLNALARGLVFVFLRNKVGHRAADCFRGAASSWASGTCRICGKSGHRIDNCEIKYEERQ